MREPFNLKPNKAQILIAELRERFDPTNNPVQKMLAELGERLDPTNNPTQKILAELHERLAPSNNPVQKMLAELGERLDPTNNPTQKILAELRERLDPSNNPVQKMLAELGERFDPINNPFNKAFSALQGQLLKETLRLNARTYLPNWYEPMIFALSTRPSETTEFLREQKNIKDRLQLFPENFYREEFWEKVNKIRDSYVGNLASSLRQAILESDDNDTAIEKIGLLYEEKIASLPEGHFLRDFALSVFITAVFTVFSMWYSSYLSGQSSVEINTLFGDVSERLNKIESRIERIENSDLSESGVNEREIYYVVKRSLSVKNRPEFDSLTIDHLSPQTEVRLVESKHKWIYVEYADYFELIPRYGWVSKKYLKKLDVH